MERRTCVGGAVPGLSHTNLPHIRIQPGEVRAKRVQIGWNGLRIEPRAHFFGEPG